MDARERFLRENTIECKPLHARISRIQCGVNITSGEYGYCQSCEERHHAIFDGSVKKNGWYCNRFENRREGTKMEESIKKYSHSQLASLAGVNAGSVCYALKVIAKGRKDLPEKAARIKAAMDKHGLILKDGSVYRPEAEESRTAPASEPTMPVTPEPMGAAVDTSPEIPSEDTRPEESPAAIPERSPEHEKAIEEIFADDWEPEQPSVFQGMDSGTGQDRSVFTTVIPRPISSFSMEELVTEITRRMPRAEVVLR